MNRLAALFTRFVSAPEWRDIAQAPFDREVELAVIGDDVGVLDGAWLRHGDDWFDAETLRPASVAATHWRYCRPSIVPACCC